MAWIPTTSVANFLEVLFRETGFCVFPAGKSTIETAFVKPINECGNKAHHEEVAWPRRLAKGDCGRVVLNWPVPPVVTDFVKYTTCNYIPT